MTRIPMFALGVLVAIHAVAATICHSNTTITRNYTLNVTAGYGSPDGFARPLLLVNGMTPGPAIEANQGETFAVTVINMLATQIGMHWHGLHQRGTPQADGVPGLNQYAIPSGGNYTYCFGTDTNYGAYWYHVHLRGIYQDGVRGSILIHPKSTVERPYTLISNDTGDIRAMHQAELSPSILMVNDWFHETSDAILLRMASTQDSMQTLCANSILFNGLGRVDCPVDTSGKISFGCGMMMEGGMSGGNMGGSASSSMMVMSASEQTAVSSSGAESTMGMEPQTQSMGMMSMPSIGLSSATTSIVQPSALTKGGSMSGSEMLDSCQNTTSARYVLSLPGNSTWNMVHLINAGAAQQLALSFDEHDFWVVSVDGAFVAPQKGQVISIGIGQRYGLMMRRPTGAKIYTIRASTMTHQTMQGTALLEYVDSVSSSSASDSTSLPWLMPNGETTNSTVKMLDGEGLVPYPTEAVPPSSREIRLEVNQSNPEVWVMESGQPFDANNGQTTPLLFSPRNASGVFWLNKGDVVDVLLQISSDSLDTMPHPIHLHGHYFRVLGSSANSTFPSNASIADVAASNGTVGMALNVGPTAPRRDTAHLPEAGWLAIRFIADNPGVWLLHCHINSHLSSGMAVAFIEASQDFPPFPNSITIPPTIAPLEVIPELQ